MSRIVKVAAWSGTKRGSVVFVHGLGGHPYGSWQRARDPDSFWPLWLAQDVEGLTVLTLGYAAPRSNWLGTAMPLRNRAVEILEILLAAPELRDGPVAFICHSLGGLLVKQILLDLDRQKAMRPEAAALVERITQIVFLATPHATSRHATFLGRLRFLAWPSAVARVLVANDRALHAINIAYRRLAQERKDGLHHRIFYETRGTGAGSGLSPPGNPRGNRRIFYETRSTGAEFVATEASADARLPGLPPIPIDADHIKTAKPADRFALQYTGIRNFVSEMPKPAGCGGICEASPLPALRFAQPWNVLPKLIRIVLLALLLTVGFKEIPIRVATLASLDTHHPKPMPGVQTSREQMPDEQKALVRQLLARSSIGTPPGAEKSVGEAVAAASRDAAAGDERMRKALELLKAGNITEAAALFLAAAIDKEATGEKNSQVAAYRNLGAIAILRDPKQALEAYRKAIENDPDDLESQYWVGWLELERGDLAEAEAHFQKVLALTRAENRGSIGHWVRFGLGDVQVQRGHLEEARRSYLDGRAKLDHLATSDPGNVIWQRDLAVSDTKVGDILVAQGNLPQALKSYRDAQAIADRLAKSDPKNVIWQRDVSVSDIKVGDVLVAQGNLPQALKSYRDALAIADRLAKSDPGNAGLQRDVSMSDMTVGDILVAQGHLPQALKSYRDAQAIADRLAKSDPENAGWQRDVSVSDNKVGDVLVAQHNLAQALKSNRDALAIADHLAKSDPGNAGWQRDLSVSYQRVGIVFFAQGHLAEGLKSFRDGLTIAARLTKLDPGNVAWQRDLSMFHENVGDVLMAQNNLPQALKSYRDGLAVAARLAKSDPGNALLQRNLSLSYDKLGTIFARLGQPGDALTALAQSRSIMTVLTRLSPENAQWRGDLVWVDRAISSLKRR
jgi:tetratricopeptide (TPR) repeat protein